MHARVARFEGMSADEVRAIGAEIRQRSEGGPPEGLPATGLTVLIDPDAGTVVTTSFFETEDDLRAGDAFLDAQMEPPAAAKGRRVSVETYEVAVERRQM